MSPTETEAPRPLATALPSFSERKLVQLKREGSIAMYAQVRQKDGVETTYEVVRIQVSPAREVFGKAYPCREVYPTNSQWGEHGWTYQHRANAEVAFEKLVNGRSSPDAQKA